MYKGSGESNIRPLHSIRSAAPSELKNKRILGTAPCFLTLAFLSHKTTTLVPPLIRFTGKISLEDFARFLHA